jgi:hypothetical protein
MKSRLVLGLAACMSVAAFSVQAGVSYVCQGSFSWDTTNVDVDLADGWAGMAAAVDFDDEGGCDTGGKDGVECTRNGKNIKNSSIDDYSAASGDFTAPLGDWDENISGDRYVTLYMDVFMPEGCNDAQAPGAYECDGVLETLDDVCYVSASGSAFPTAAEACEDSYDFNSEGMFAEGMPFSENRHPKNGVNKSWAMYVDLGAPASCEGETDEFDTEGVCTAAVEVEAIADGGDFGEDGAEAGVDYLDVGDITFTPNDTCVPVAIEE